MAYESMKKQNFGIEIELTGIVNAVQKRCNLF